MGAAVYRTLLASPILPDIVADGSYVVISLKKCMRGRPLLTLSAQPQRGPADWERDRCLPLASYLSDFLSTLGAPEVAVFDSLDGWRLAPYQAAMRRNDWAMSWKLLEEPFKEMRSAYRHLYGGTAAPDLSLNTKPKFVEPAKSVGHVDEAHDRAWECTTKSTFLHFEVEKQCLRKSGSSPDLETSVDVLSDTDVASLSGTSLRSSSTAFGSIDISEDSD